MVTQNKTWRFSKWIKMITIMCGRKSTSQHFDLGAVISSLLKTPALALALALPPPLPLTDSDSAGHVGCIDGRGRGIGGAWPYWPCWAPIVGWGAFGSPGPGPGPPWGGRLPVEPAGLPPRRPGAPTLWLSEVPPLGSPLPFSGWRPRLSLRWFSWGSRALGVSGCLGPGSFPCLLHALRDGAVVPHTHY